MSTDFRSEKSVTMTRRGALRAGAGAATAAVAYPAVDPVQDADACGGMCIGAVALAAGAAGLIAGAKIGIMSEDVPSDSLGPDAFKNMIYDAAHARESTNASTIVDNQNLIAASNGGDVWFMEAKAEAVNAIQDRQSQSEVEAVAIQKLNGVVATVQENFLKSWNEGARELYSWRAAANEAGVNISNNFRTPSGNSDDNWYILDNSTQQVTLADGTNMDVKTVAMEVNTIDGMKGNEWHATTENISNSGSGGWCNPSVEVNYGDKDNFTYLDYNDWQPLWSEIKNVRDTVKNNLVMWIDNAYSEVQNNEDFTAEDLRTPLDLMDDMAGPNSQAVASLMALGIPVDAENSATIELQNQVNERMTGMLAVDGWEGGISQGDTIDPNATDADGNPIYDGWYISHDISAWSADVMDRVDTDYGIQDGKIRITKDPTMVDNDPVDNVVYVVETSAGDSARVKPGDFSDEGSYWQADLSDSLSSLVTNVEAMNVYLDVDETQYVTETIDTTFEVVESSGALTFDRPRELQDDNNYTTPEEWQRSQETMTDNMESWKDANDGGSIFGGLFDGDSDLKKYALLGGAAILGLFGLGQLSD